MYDIEAAGNLSHQGRQAGWLPLLDFPSGYLHTAGWLIPRSFTGLA